MSQLFNTDMDRGAQFSQCRRYRFVLWRIWDESKPMCSFIGLNPSTADESINDPTVRRCINYARDWGYGGLYMLNLFGWRETDRLAMLRELEPVGEGNDEAIVEYASKSGIVIAAWGADGGHMRRDRRVCRLVPDLHCLKVTRGGFPGHPLYLPKTLRPKLYQGRE